MIRIISVHVHGGGTLSPSTTVVHLATVRRRRLPSDDMSPVTQPFNRTTRRAFVLLLNPAPLIPLLPHIAYAASEEEEEEEEEDGDDLERYTDHNEGFTLLRPSSWLQVEKPGATVLFVEKGKGSSNNIGVVVNPVKLVSLTNFGSPQFVADKLIQAERRKESTKEAEVVRVGKRSGHGGLVIYELEYAVDSTREGKKRVFTAAFAAAGKLYLLNISHSDGPKSPIDAKTRDVLEQVLHSFDASR